MFHKPMQTSVFHEKIPEKTYIKIQSLFDLWEPEVT